MNDPARTTEIPPATKTWRTCNCRHQHGSIRQFVECVMPGALIEGQGRFALISECSSPVVWLWPQVHEAQLQKQALDGNGCGNHCIREHRLMRIELEQR